MRPALPLLALLVPALLLTRQATAGDEIPFATKVWEADAIMELQVSVQGAIPPQWPNQDYDPQGWAFPDALSAPALASAQVTRSLKGAGGLPAALHVFPSTSACWWAAWRTGTLRALVFLDQQPDGTWRQVFGVEHGWGAYTDINPRYAELVAAIEQAVVWGATADAAGGATADAGQTPQAALASPNPYLALLAQETLTRLGVDGSGLRPAGEKPAVWPSDKGFCLATQGQ